MREPYPRSLQLGGRWGEAPLIVASSVCNALGYTAAQVWALRRAEVCGYASTPFHTPSGGRLTLGHVRSLSPQTGGLERLCVLSRRALKPLLEALGKIPPGTQVGLLLCLPERLSPISKMGRLQADVNALLTSAGITPSWELVDASGSAALAVALCNGAATFHAREVDLWIVGGVNTYFDPEVVETLLDKQQLFDGENLDSRVGGEGAAYFALATRSLARRMKWEPLGQLEVAAVGWEPATLENQVPCQGVGLSTAGRIVSERLQSEQRTLDWWMCDLTAEELRAQELQLALPRVGREVMPSEAALEFIPEHLGDLGAATLPTGVVIALEGFRRGDPRARCCMISGSSQSGLRGVVLVSAPPAERRA